jgi:flavin-dependent dehydrogenase
MPHIAILGAGPAGAAAAIALARAGLDVTLFHRPAAAGFQPGECLPPHAKPLLRELGVGETFCNAGHLPCYGNASAWGSDGLETTDFIRHPYGHAWHLDRPAFDRMMVQAACQAGAALRDAGPELEIAAAANGWKIAAQNVDWVVDCTGRQAWFARRLGVRRRVLDTLVSHLAVFAAREADPERLTLIEAAPDGWWYTAGIPGNRRVAAYHTASGSDSGRALHTPEGFLARIAETSHIRPRLAFHDLLDPPSVRPANTSRLEQFAGERWLAAGDAAAAYDPLSSHGILIALDSGLRAARAIIDGAVSRYQVFLEQHFESYLRQRAQYYSLETRWQDAAFWRARAT